MDRKTNIYDLADLCKLAGVTTRTVRYYIQQGILPSAGQTGPGLKYHKGHLGRLMLIRKLQREHLPLAEIRRRLDTMDDKAVGAELEYIQISKSLNSSGNLDAALKEGDSHPYPQERSQWERFGITNDIEIHVRRPLSRFDNRQLDELIRVASELFSGEEQVNAITGSVSILAADATTLAHLEEVVSLIKDTARRLGFRLSVSQGSWDENSDLLEEVEERDIVRDVSKLQDKTVKMIWTPSRLADNWFSHWHNDFHISVSSTAQWDDTAPLPITAFIAYEILLYGISSVAPDYDIGDFAHEDTRGCIYDFCGHRPDIEIVLQASDICPSCQSKLDQFGIDRTAHAEYREVIRTLAEG